MPGSDNANSTARQRRKQDHSVEQKGMPPYTSRLNTQASSTSMESIHIQPRTPRSSRNEVEMSLLANQEGRDILEEVGEEDSFLEAKPKPPKPPLSSEDKSALALLIVLYLIQGVPLGLALGSVPFLLREHLSYSQLGVFALSAYPYSLKLLWSPIVDSIFFQGVGRRKSWIIPMQLIIGSLMLWIASNVQVLIDEPTDHVYLLTFIFTSLVFFSATQDIAVDGWALTLLSEENLGYASTCQTIGLNTGYFASFTVFLALNSEAFSHKWGIPQLSLATYLRFWSVICFCVTLWLVFVKKEKPSPDDEDMSVTKVYRIMWRICTLKHVQSLLLVHLVCKIGFQANEAVTSLKLVEKGLGREDLALAVLIDFPCQIVAGWLAARWSIGDKPLRPWLYAFWVRLGFAAIWTVIVAGFPNPPISNGFFSLLILTTVLEGFSRTMQFVGISAFHTRISDPLIGGTYMTLLNTFTNLGGTWPKYFVLKGVDLFSIATCKVTDSLTVAATECVSDTGKAKCSEIGGECITERDGYYIVSTICITVGTVMLIFYIAPTARKLQALSTSKWRVNMS
ncbi:MFS general substrate transporter [Rickenella mellea]|uniref:MFS general substrate transporter n=1 Tax=Rickenella mellea TaxID=50990 RepID=A0A4Y7QMQ2_9AGAM|nr:MFS general substrate transporter [Rickenella mellea]